MNSTTADRVTTARLLLAFLAVYLIWGSTYLAIRISIESIPPFLMAGVRFAIAGAILFVWGGFRGATRPTWIEWRSAGIVGALLLVGGNGGVVWAQQWVPSGIAALVVATVPLWMVSLDWLVWKGPRPGPYLTLGLLSGLIGVGLLASGADFALHDARHGTIGGIVLLCAALSWAIGSLYARRAPLPVSRYRSVGMQMLVGGTLLTGISFVAGEMGAFEAEAVTGRSFFGLIYLIFFGAIVGYSAYIWLLSNTTPAKASTYAYVNPVVALFLGWLILGEPLGGRTLFASTIIVGAVALVTARGRTRTPGAPASRQTATR